MNPNLFQLGYVCEDLQVAAEWITRYMGAPAFDFTDRLTLPDVVVDGTPSHWAIDQAFAQLGDVQIELIRPVEGAIAMYRDMIVPGTPATFHHVGIRVDTWAEAEDQRQRFGLEWTTLGHTPNICDFGYLDTRRTIGHYVEFLYLYPGVRDR
jgi:hypothetical protein